MEAADAEPLSLLALLAGESTTFSEDEDKDEEQEDGTRQAGGADSKDRQRIILQRERNRVHARASRAKRKGMMDGLKDNGRQIEAQHTHLAALWVLTFGTPFISASGFHTAAGSALESVVDAAESLDAGSSISVDPAQFEGLDHATKCRERNKLHARKSRLRKKALNESLKCSLERINADVAEMRQGLAARLGAGHPGLMPLQLPSAAALPAPASAAAPAQMLLPAAQHPGFMNTAGIHIFNGQAMQPMGFGQMSALPFPPGAFVFMAPPQAMAMGPGAPAFMPGLNGSGPGAAFMPGLNGSGPGAAFMPGLNGSGPGASFMSGLNGSGPGAFMPSLRPGPGPLPFTFMPQLMPGGGAPMFSAASMHGAGAPMLQFPAPAAASAPSSAAAAISDRVYGGDSAPSDAVAAGDGGGSRPRRQRQPGAAAAASPDEAAEAASGAGEAQPYAKRPRRASRTVDA